ncbi:helix-turn-helix domain-containing protein [Erwinia psidii]|uniref:Uncharacterized protein n=1 Tax=Erwinia psidii TaxID=69224 RepID=A0A3N6S094_9GAMM|nr:helix-turn-helix domain-containing protein [Erwinia psidii]MCX8958728.1 hypothetical protein [Erwinia psidii]MCX8966686.1 hypothetical protein [Erwinia psidii]RQM38938.1 hypothetical protein EB241_07055 [Erwinia psidii]
MIHTTNPIIKYQAGLLNLAEDLSNLSKAGNIMGVLCNPLYRCRELANKGGVNTLFNHGTGAHKLNNRIDVATKMISVRGFTGRYCRNSVS